MTESMVHLRRKISGAANLQSVVRTMKLLSASSIGQYEKSLSALNDYSHAVELGLGLNLRKMETIAQLAIPKKQIEVVSIGAVVLGSDQGMVGGFNDTIANYALAKLTVLSPNYKVWVLGERIQTRLMNAGLAPIGQFKAPNSVYGITKTVGQILLECEKLISNNEITELYLFYNRPLAETIYTPFHLRLLPLDEHWYKKHIEILWPTKYLPEVIADKTITLRALIREYLFVSLFRACVESLASENASRLAAMQRAEKNIEELLTALTQRFHHLRQNTIDEELFEVISGFESLKKQDIAG